MEERTFVGVDITLLMQAGQRKQGEASRLPAHLAHAFEDDGAVARHALGVALEGAGRMAVRIGWRYPILR
jgi:hypothetical protein